MEGFSELVTDFIDAILHKTQPNIVKTINAHAKNNDLKYSSRNIIPFKHSVGGEVI
jgi:hypothetical protein